MDIGEATNTKDTTATTNTVSTDTNSPGTNRICPLKFIDNPTLPIQWAGCVQSRCAWFDQAAEKCAIASLCKAVKEHVIITRTATFDMIRYNQRQYDTTKDNPTRGYTIQYD